MIDNQTVGKNIAALRQQTNLSQQGLANLCSVTHQAVSKWENGMALPDMQTLLFLSKYFEVSMEDILMGNLSVRTDTVNVSTDDTETCENIRPVAEDQDALSAACGEEYEEAMAAAGGNEYREAMAAAGKQEEEKTPSMDWKQIAHLAPFASRGIVEQLVREKAEKGDLSGWDQVIHLLPFCSRSMANYLLDKLDTGTLDWKYATGIMVHASRDRVDRIFEKFLGEMDLEKLCQIAPFVSRKFTAACLRKMEDVDSDKVLRHLLPFLPRELVDEVILKKMGKRTEQKEKQPERVMLPEGEKISAPEKAAMQNKKFEKADEPPFRPEERAEPSEEKILSDMPIGPVKPPPKERTLMRIARKAVEEGNEKWLEEHGEALTQAELEIILPLAAQKQMWGALEELQEHADDDALTAAAKAAADGEQWEMLEEMLDRLDRETLHAILDVAMAKSNWDMMDETLAHLDEE